MDTDDLSIRGSLRPSMRNTLYFIDIKYYIANDVFFYARLYYDSLDSMKVF